MTPDEALARLKELRAADPPTHGGRVLSYVYDHGRPDLDALVGEAVAALLPVNGLDPTTFGSVAVLERDLVSFGRMITRGDGEVVGSVTSGGTESCLLAVKVARDLWRRDHPDGSPTMVMATTGHAAFRKAAHYLGVAVVEVSVDPTSGRPDLGAVLSAVEQTGPALVVLSAPSYPYGVLDPIADVAQVCAERGILLHVDACVGGFLLPFVPEPPAPWDFSVTGVTSISLDLHKYGYSPKGASLLLHRGRERHHAQYFASKAWPGYPVVNPTVLGSRSATSLGAAWAVTQTLGVAGYRELVGQIATAWNQLTVTIGQIAGLRVVGTPVPGLLAVATDPDGGAEAAVDPFLLVDEVRRRGFLLQAQPGATQPDGSQLPRTAHLTITPVTSTIVDELCAALVTSSDAVRGVAPPQADLALVGRVAQQGLPADLAVVMATLEALPAEIAEPALAAILQSVIDPDRT